MEIVKEVYALATIEEQKGAATLKGFEGLFQNAVSAILGLAGIVLFLMLIAGGFRYITSGGDPKSAAGARGTLTFAIIGLVVIAGAFLILRFIEDLTGATVTQFKIGP